MPSARKLKLKLPRPKPRNPVVVPALKRKAGKHGRGASAERRAQKLALVKALREND